ncbi:conserved hypothetical protein [Thermoplasma acidophilum]|uniref:Uncharacterized protein n=1 Tax=Thermoplasma acidophilum (strain ATCC 25905 / DSM 1728 / JCM 9062 / NBRC 15155 / AMRC-C165) TaxID=273075 RepID=Q9HKQ7_THEAC|nr:conserved hypothetical protein [Thermoplasma acidophilum]
MIEMCVCGITVSILIFPSFSTSAMAPESAATALAPVIPTSALTYLDIRNFLTAATTSSIVEFSLMLGSIFLTAFAASSLVMPRAGATMCVGHPFDICIRYSPRSVSQTSLCLDSKYSLSPISYATFVFEKTTVLLSPTRSPAIFLASSLSFARYACPPSLSTFLIVRLTYESRFSITFIF